MLHNFFTTTRRNEDNINTVRLMSRYIFATGVVQVSDDIESVKDFHSAQILPHDNIFHRTK